MQTDTASFSHVPVDIHYDHHASKQREFTCKHKKGKTFEAGFNTMSKSYAPQPATLAGQEETPRWLSSIPKCVQSRNCCPAQKFPENIHCTHTWHGVTSQPSLQKERLPEARKQPAKQCLGVNPGPSNKHFYSSLSQILTPAPKEHLPNTLFTQRESPALQKLPQSPTTLLMKAASPSHTLLSVFSDTCEFLITRQLLYVCSGFFSFISLKDDCFFVSKPSFQKSVRPTHSMLIVFSPEHSRITFTHLLGRSQTGLRLMPPFNQTQLSRNSHSSAGNVTPISQAAKHSGALHAITAPW